MSKIFQISILIDNAISKRYNPSHQNKFFSNIKITNKIWLHEIKDNKTSIYNKKKSHKISSNFVKKIT